MEKWWPHLRAVLVLLHLVAMLVLATPNLGSAMSRDAWKQPTVQQEFEAWAARLRGFGIDTDAPALEEWAWGAATRWSGFRDWLKKPFQPYADYAGVRQRWRMFAAPHRFPERLVVDVRRGGEWHRIFVAGSRHYDWRRKQLMHDRMRSALFRYGWPHYRDSYERLCDWLAARALEDFDDADALACAVYRAATPTPEQTRRGEVPPGSYDAEVRIRLRGEP